jgi:type IV secretion system protein VirB11
MAVIEDGPATYLDFYLGPLRGFLDDPAVTDVYINRAGEVWTESLGGRIERHAMEALTAPALWRLARQIANHSHQAISRRHPLLAATLPDGSRVQVVAPPATREGMAFAFRKHAAQAPDLSSYEWRHPGAETGAAPKPAPAELTGWGGYAGFLRQAVHRRLNLVISGGTSSGKTTLMNTLLQEVDHGERIILIEDTPELRLAHDNAVGLVAVRGGEGETRVNSVDMLQAALRMRPDRILLGELRGPEAFTFLRAINTGHPGSMTTLHADSPQQALTQLAMMALQAGSGISFAELREVIAEMVDAVVQLERVGEQRRIGRPRAARIAGCRLRLTRVLQYAIIRFMFDATPDAATEASPTADPTIEVCERHLKLLAEVGEIAMAVTRALGRSAVVAGKEVEEVLATDAWHPETARARALAGSKDAADAFAKATRALRLTFALEKTTAELLRDLRAGILPERKTAPALSPAGRLSEALGAPPATPRDLLKEKVRDVVTDAVWGACDISPTQELADDLNERLIEADRFGRLLCKPLREVVEHICAEVRLTHEWMGLFGDEPAPSPPPPLPEWFIQGEPGSRDLVCVRREIPPPPDLRAPIPPPELPRRE